MTDKRLSNVSVINENQSLGHDIKIEIPEISFTIENLDVDVEIIKTNEGKLNICNIELWNLSDSSLAKINNKNITMNIYSNYRSDSYSLIFSGNIKTFKKKTAKSSKSKKLKRYHKAKQFKTNVSGADVSTSIVLEEGYKDFLSLRFSKTYRDEISSNTIIKDLVSATPYNLIYQKNVIDEIVFKRGKQVHGSIRNKLSWIVRSIGAKWTISNGNIQIIDNKSHLDNYTIELNSNNIYKPEVIEDGKISIVSQLFMFLNPNDLVSLRTKKYNGEYAILKTTHQFNNYGTSGETTLIVEGI